MFIFRVNGISFERPDVYLIVYDNFSFDCASHYSTYILPVCKLMKYESNSGVSQPYLTTRAWVIVCLSVAMSTKYVPASTLSAIEMLSVVDSIASL